jgi:hypothetical protein
MRKLGYKALIDFHVTLNPKDPQYLMLKVKQPGWLFNAHYYNDTSFVASYKYFLVTYVSLMSPNLEKSRVEEQVTKMIDLERFFSTVC